MMKERHISLSITHHQGWCVLSNDILITGELYGSTIGNTQVISQINLDGGPVGIHGDDISKQT